MVQKWASKGKKNMGGKIENRKLERKRSKRCEKKRKESGSLSLSVPPTLPFFFFFLLRKGK